MTSIMGTLPPPSALPYSSSNSSESMVRALLFDDTMSMFTTLVSSLFATAAAITPIATTAATARASSSSILQPVTTPSAQLSALSPSPAEHRTISSTTGGGSSSRVSVSSTRGISIAMRPLLRGMERRQAMLRCRELRTLITNRPDGNRAATLMGGPLLSPSSPPGPTGMTTGDAGSPFQSSSSSVGSKANVSLLPATATVGLSSETEALLNEYRSLKAHVRDSSAAIIQARYRGYMARKPISSIGGAEAQLDSLQRSLRFIHAQRREAKPPRVLPMTGWTPAQLTSEKRCLKSILSQHQARLARKLGRAPTRQDKEGYRPIYKMYREVKDLIAGVHHGHGAQHHSAVVSDGIRTSTSPDPEADSLDSPPSAAAASTMSGKNGNGARVTSFAPNTNERKGVAVGGSQSRSTTTPTPSSSSSISVNATPAATTVGVAATATTTTANGSRRGVIASGGRKGLEQARRSGEGLPAGAAAAIAAANPSSKPSMGGSMGMGGSSSQGALGNGALLEPNMHGSGGLLVPTAMPVITSGGVTSSPLSSSSSMVTGAQAAQAAAAARAGVGVMASPSASHIIHGGHGNTPSVLASPAVVSSLAMNAPQSPLKAAVVERMKAEKRQLQIKLNRFEQTFRQLKGRPIKYAKDIAPVRAEWLRYKTLKAELAGGAAGPSMFAFDA